MYLEFNKIREEESIRILDEVRALTKEYGASEEALKQIPISLENLDDEININSINKVTYLKMKQMLENAKRLRSTEFFYQNEESIKNEEEVKTFQEKWQEYTPIEEEKPYTFQRKWKIQRAKEEQENK